ncbi:MAG: exosortase/archaeosortase family protein, partial [bacterium]
MSIFFFPAVEWLFVSWAENLYYSHGFLVFITAVIWGFLALRKKSAFQAPLNKSGITLYSAVVLIVFISGRLSGLNSLKAVSYILALLFLVEITEGRDTGAKLARPALLLALAVPMPFLPEIVGVFQKTTIYLTSVFMSASGVHISITGNIVSAGNASFTIGGGCSGFYSAAVLPVLTFAAASLLKDTFPRSLFLTLLSIPCALTANTLRVVCLLWIGMSYGEAVAMSFWHSAASLFFYVVALLLIWFVRHPLRFSALILPLLLVPACLEAETGFNKHPTDTSQYVFTTHQGYFLSKTNLFYANNIESLPLQIGGWKGEDEGTDDPRVLFLRGYEKPGSDAYIHLLVVHGREESRFHIAEVCYTDDNWTLEKRNYKRFTLNGESFGARYFLARSGEYRHLVAYWFLWKNTSRIITDGAIMIRVSAEVYNNDIAKAESDLLDFI